MKHKASIELIYPDWPAAKQIQACVTTRSGGVSQPPFDALNLASHVKDNPVAVAINRQRLKEAVAMPGEPCWLNQVHGQAAIDASLIYDAPPDGDAAYTNKIEVVCSVLTADCLPVLFTDIEGTCVGAAHAGWRGLANGVLEATIARLPARPADLMVWMGPAIGPDAFEVGDEVRVAFVARRSETALAFRAAERESLWYANIYQLAEEILSDVGVSRIYGGGFCTYTDSERFYSFRRDGETGRMATSIWIAASGQ